MITIFSELHYIDHIIDVFQLDFISQKNSLNNKRIYLLLLSQFLFFLIVIKKVSRRAKKELYLI